MYLCVVSSLGRVLSFGSGAGAATGSASACHVLSAGAASSWLRRGTAAILAGVAWRQHHTSRAYTSNSSQGDSMGGNGGEDPDIRNRKKETRRKVGALVDALSEEEIVRQSAIITAKVLAHPLYQRAKSVSVYLSFAKEVRTDDLVKDILTSGRSCYIPRFEPGKPDMEMVHLASLEDLTSLPVNKWGIRQPAIGEKRRTVFDAGELDVMLVPGLAFTASGRRCGRGKGYYDTFLTRCFKELRARPATLALAFREQILPEEELPVEAYDVPMDAVLFPDA